MDEELEDLMEKAIDAFEKLLDLICVDESDVTGQLIPHNASIDLIVSATPRDRDALQQGADHALQTLADLIGTQSGIATVSIQID